MKLGARPGAVAAGRPFAHAVDGQNGSRLEWRREKGAGRVRFVVLGEKHLAVKTHLIRNRFAHEELLAKPQRHRLHERADAGRRVVEIRLEQALELLEGLIVENDIINIGKRNLGLTKAKANSIFRKARIVLFTSEAFLLGGSDNLSIHH